MRDRGWGGERGGEDRNTNFEYQEQKELFRWNKKTVSIVFEGLVWNKNLMKIADRIFIMFIFTNSLILKPL